MDSRFPAIRVRHAVRLFGLRDSFQFPLHGMHRRSVPSSWRAMQASSGFRFGGAGDLALCL